MGIVGRQDPESDEFSRGFAPEDVLKQIDGHADAVQREQLGDAHDD
jgi:hypothetical protein